MMELVLITTAFITISIATIYDIKARYVPDYASYSFIAIALIQRILYTIEINNPLAIIWTLPATGLLFGIGYILYKAGMWGGGDTKIITSTAILLAWFPNETTPLFIDFFMNLLILGALYTFITTIIIAHKNKLGMNTKEKIITTLSSTSIILYILIPNGLSILLSASIIMSSFITYFKRIEQKLFIKKANMNTLMDGDWLVKPVKIGNKIIKTNKEGLTKKEAELIKKAWNTGKLKTKPIIKEGIAYLPAFLITLTITIIGTYSGTENIMITLMTI